MVVNDNWNHHQQVWTVKTGLWSVTLPSHHTNLNNLELEELDLCLFCYRGLFIIDDKGILRQITMNDLPVGRSVDEVLRLVQAFKFTDEHGEGEEDISF